MIIIKKGISAFGLAIALFPNVASAQKSDAKSKQLLEEVKSYYNSNANNYFKFSFGSGTGTSLRSQPGIFYSSGAKYRLKIMGIEQIYDGNKIYNISQNDSEITIAKPSPGSALFSPINYLNTYSKEYNLSYDGKKSVNGIQADVVKLTPVKSNGIAAVYLYINSAAKQMVKLEQYATNKNLSIISITQFIPNQKLDPGMFVFSKSKYKNYIITEL